MIIFLSYHGMHLVWKGGRVGPIVFCVLNSCDDFIITKNGPQRLNKKKTRIFI